MLIIVRGRKLSLNAQWFKSNIGSIMYFNLNVNYLIIQYYSWKCETITWIERITKTNILCLYCEVQQGRDEKYMMVSIKCQCYNLLMTSSLFSHNTKYMSHIYIYDAHRWLSHQYIDWKCSLCKQKKAQTKSLKFMVKYEANGQNKSSNQIRSTTPKQSSEKAGNNRNTLENMSNTQTDYSSSHKASDVL